MVGAMIQAFLHAALEAEGILNLQSRSISYRYVFLQTWGRETPTS